MLTYNYSFLGHFGVIELPFTIIHPYFLTEVVQILNKICPGCKSFRQGRRVKVRYLTPCAEPSDYLLTWIRIVDSDFYIYSGIIYILVTYTLHEWTLFFLFLIYVEGCQAGQFIIINEFWVYFGLGYYIKLDLNFYTSATRALFFPSIWSLIILLEKEGEEGSWNCSCC